MNLSVEQQNLDGSIEIYLHAPFSDDLRRVSSLWEDIKKTVDKIMNLPELVPDHETGSADEL